MYLFCKSLLIFMGFLNLFYEWIFFILIFINYVSLVFDYGIPCRKMQKMKNKIYDSRDGTLIVQDDKFTGNPQTYDLNTQPYPSQLLQVLAYLNSNYSAKKSKDPSDWFEMPHTQKKWQIRICNRKTREPYKIFSDYQDTFSLHYLYMSLEKFATISLGITNPEHHNSVHKCNACNLKSFCEYKI